MSALPRSRLDALICEQENVQRLDRETIEAIQLEKLNRLLAREKERRGFYRALPERVDALSQLAELPFTTDEDLASRGPELLLCSQARIQRVLSDATSGTTGTPKRVFYTEGDCEDTISLYMAGLGELIFPGSVTLIGFPFSGPYGLGELIAEAVERLGARPLRAGPLMSFKEYTALLESKGPDTFVGMPVQLLGLLRFCGRGSLRRALVSGDACPETVIRGCEDILGSRLFPHYGSREMGMAGAICCQAHEGMHLRENHIIAEIIDGEGRVLPPGEWGELVITTVGMEAMPLIRYRTGDYTRVLPGPCPCGSETLRLDSLRRRRTGLDAADLDEAVFADPSAADCDYALEEGCLRVRVLTVGPVDEPALLGRLRALCPDRRILLSAERLRPEDRACSPGKRTLR